MNGTGSNPGQSKFKSKKTDRYELPKSNNTQRIPMKSDIIAKNDLIIAQSIRNGGGTGRKNEPKNKRKGRCRRGPPSSVCFVLMARFSLMDSIVSISKSIDFHGRSTGPFRSGNPSGVVFTARYVTIRKKISRNSITDAIQFHSEMPYLESQKS